MGGPAVDTAIPDVTINSSSSAADEADAAGAHLPSSPNLSIYSSLSEKVQVFVDSEQRNTFEVGALSSIRHHVFSHYEWNKGNCKGDRIDFNTAEILLRQPSFQKDNLKPIWILEEAPAHSDSIELQNMLGETKVSEYGSFVDQHE
jgi:hypothetical protein